MVREMKKTMVSALLLLMVLLPACAGGGPVGETVIYRDEKVPIIVKVNQEFVIAVVSNPSSGYMWREEFDDKFVEVTASTFEINEGMRGTEAGLEQHFRFKARRKGTTEVEINLKAPDLSTVREREFTVNIK